jgi:hypothetical protein
MFDTDLPDFFLLGIVQAIKIRVNPVQLYIFIKTELQIVNRTCFAGRLT